MPTIRNENALNRYLVCSRDESVAHWTPLCFAATSERQALEKYLRTVWAKADVFRKSVLDLAVNMSFLEQFYLSSDHEMKRFNASGEVGTEEEIVRSRIKTFFSTRPDLGERFLSYMDTEDRSLITEELFEYIALSEADSEDKHGCFILDLDALEIID